MQHGATLTLDNCLASPLTTMHMHTRQQAKLTAVVEAKNAVEVTKELTLGRPVDLALPVTGSSSSR